jgi:Fe2+ transport system protein FeoA
MGFLSDNEILVLSNENGGQIVLSVKDSKVVIGGGMAGKLMVY